MAEKIVVLIDAYVLLEADSESVCTAAEEHRQALKNPPKNAQTVSGNVAETWID